MVGDGAIRVAVGMLDNVMVQPLIGKAKPMSLGPVGQ